MKKPLSGRHAHGQAAVEFALALPFLLMCLLATIYFGRVFYITQVVSYAAQEGSKMAAKLPNLVDASVRTKVRGFDRNGHRAYVNSVIYQALGGAHLLSQGQTGDLPKGAKVLILPWDANGQDFNTAPGTVSIFISYPFSLLGETVPNGTGSDDSHSLSVTLLGDNRGKEAAGTPMKVSFPDLNIQYQATAPQEVYQEGN
jgi:TadE-like protein